MNDMRKPINQMCEIRHPPTQTKSGFFSLFFLASRVRTPTYKIIISPEKLRARGLWLLKNLENQGYIFSRSISSLGRHSSGCMR